jgi:hypothetical protein
MAWSNYKISEKASDEQENTPEIPSNIDDDINQRAA